MATIETVKDLLETEIKDLYSAEKQLLKALPKMAAGARDPELKEVLKDHLSETEQQVARLEKVASIVGTTLTGKVCKGMEGIIAEGSEVLSEQGEPDLLDLGIIGAASRVEHYEMAGYMTAIAFAEELELEEAVALLNETLSEENAAEDSLRDLSVRLLSDLAGDTEDDVVPTKRNTKHMGNRTESRR